MIVARGLNGIIIGKPKVLVMCICGVEKMVYQSRLDRNRGYYCTMECRNIAIGLHNRFDRDYSTRKMPTGKNHHGWKDDKVGYVALHDWVKKMLAMPLACGQCEEVRLLSLANISGLYTRDLNDWRWLCYSCHKKMDLQNPKRAKELFKERRLD